MSVKIRLTRMGKKKQPSYRVVVMDSRRPRDGAYIEQIGTYDPRREPSLIEIDNDKAVDWLRKGAQPTDRARKLLEISGAWTRFRVAKGDIHTIEHAIETPSSPPPTTPSSRLSTSLPTNRSPKRLRSRSTRLRPPMQPKRRLPNRRSRGQAMSHPSTMRR